MDSMLPPCRVVLFEPRTLVRTGICSILRDQHCDIVHCVSLEQLSEALCDSTDNKTILLAGAGGSGNMIPGLIRTLHYTRALPLTSIVYLPGQDPLLVKMFVGAGADRCFSEDELPDTLHKTIAMPVTAQCRKERLSSAELNVLLDYASGLQTREIAVRRNCSYKTVFTFKRNARIRLDIDTGSGWVKLMTHLAQLVSLYE